MARRWSMSPYRPELAEAMARRLNVHPVVGQLMLNRRVETEAQGQAFLQRKLTLLHDPELLPGVSEAADRLHRAVQQGKQICIYGDYDVDGMCATAILLECFRLAGTRPRFYVPDRFEEGYGVNEEALRRLRAEGVDVVVTVDCGVASVAEARVAREIGLEYIVTDHHEFGPELPECAALVHPRSPGSKYPFGLLCGAGVAFKLAWELSRRFTGQRKVSEQFQKFLLDVTTLTAIATVCDIVELSDENRVLVHYGLTSLRKDPPIGLRCLMDVAELSSKEKLTSGDLGFTLGPRLNACGRLGQARLGVELLTTKDEQRGRDLARLLDEENKQRQTLERRIFTEAKALAEKNYAMEDKVRSPVIVLAAERNQWHPGVIGIVASRMVERYHRPCVLISLDGDTGSGSGRSVKDFHLQQALTACNGLLLRCGGHAMAAGFKIKRDQVEEFRARFSEFAAGVGIHEKLTGEITLDMEVPLHILNFNFVRSLEVMEPFGLGNPTPLFLASNLAVVGEPRKVGNGERHLSFRVQQGSGAAMNAIAFEQGDRLEELLSDQRRCCLAFTPILNNYNGYVTVQLRVRDLRAGSHPLEVKP